MAVSNAGIFKVASRHLFAGVGVPSLPWGSWKGRIIKSWGSENCCSLYLKIYRDPSLQKKRLLLTMVSDREGDEEGGMHWNPPPPPPSPLPHK